MSVSKVAIIGSSGYVGRFLTTEFVDALKSGKIGELRIITRESDDYSKFKVFESKGAKVSPVEDLTKADQLCAAFSGVDIVMSALGTGPGTDEVKQSILSALPTAGVKVYFPSEFGTNHYTRMTCSLTHEIFQKKADHFKAAQAIQGLKTVRILNALIMECTFGKWFGLDNRMEVWNLVGNGETPVAVCSEKDVAKFSLQAALKAFENPDSVPDLIEVYSDIKTMKEYAQAFDKVAKRETKIEFRDMCKAIDDYKSSHSFEELLQILFEAGAFNYGNPKAEGNELLNPGETLWKLKKIEEYAEETEGRPWKDV